jgi:hypothetical protein
LPRFIKDEFDAFLECGILANGFLRLRCGESGNDRLLAFSCKRRGFCPSCGARRMSQTSAHLADHVIPQAPVRQLDGVYRSQADGVPEFIEAAAPTEESLHALLQTVTARLMERLTRRGVRLRDAAQSRPAYARHHRAGALMNLCMLERACALELISRPFSAPPLRVDPTEVAARSSKMPQIRGEPTWGQHEWNALCRTVANKGSGRRC